MFSILKLKLTHCSGDVYRFSVVMEEFLFCEDLKTTTQGSRSLNNMIA